VCDGETKRAALKLVCETSSSLFASMPNASGQARTLARAVFLSGILNPAALARIESAVKAEMERMDGGRLFGAVWRRRLWFVRHLLAGWGRIDGERQKGWRRFVGLTPAASFRRAKDSIRDANESIKATVLDVAKRNAKPSEVPEDIRSINDAKERFEAMYRANNWTPGEIRNQIKALRRTRLVGILMGSFSILSVFFLVFIVPGWLLIFVVPTGSCLAILSFAQVFKYALWETQIRLREFIGVKEFVSRDDFWVRLLG